jgi:hypothetical protein
MNGLAGTDLWQVGVKEKNPENWEVRGADRLKAHSYHRGRLTPKSRSHLRGRFDFRVFIVFKLEWRNEED